MKNNKTMKKFNDFNKVEQTNEEIGVTHTLSDNEWNRLEELTTSVGSIDQFSAGDIALIAKALLAIETKLEAARRNQERSMPR
jgi:hypothetical protein